MKRLNDVIAKAHIDRRIDRLTRGNPGNIEPIGEGCSEMKIDYGPGYRVYYKDTGEEEDVIAHLTVALEENEIDFLLSILNSLVRSKGMAQIAAELGVSREGLIKPWPPAVIRRLRLS